MRQGMLAPVSLALVRAIAIMVKQYQGTNYRIVPLTQCHIECTRDSIFANPFDPPELGERGRSQAANQFQSFTRQRILSRDSNLLFILQPLMYLKAELSPNRPLLLGWHFPDEPSHCDTLAIAADYLESKQVISIESKVS